MQQLRNNYSLTFPPLSIARYSFIQLSRLRRREVKENAQTSKRYQRGFEPGLSRLRVRHSTTEPPRSTWCTCYVLYAINTTKVLKFMTDECRGVVTNYGVRDSMCAEHHPQFVDGYCGCGSGCNMCFNPLRMCINRHQYHLAHKWSCVVDVKT